MRMREIKLIDIINPNSMSRIGSVGLMNPSGLIAVYRNCDYAYVPKFGEIYIKGRLIPSIKGFDGPSAFYSPKYTLENIASPLPDLRATLYWNPDVSFENGKASVDFFTSDILSDYMVYVEGVTKEGKICFGTTSFSVDKNKMSLAK